MSAARSHPLKSATPPGWAERVLQDPLALLSDQAYLEKKAANNALEFMNLWPGGKPPAKWLPSIATIARDETQHLGLVLKHLAERGGSLQRTHKNPYAADLGDLVRKGQGGKELADRLLVSGLIEARSCERFERLAEVCEDKELGRFYAGLVASENGHHRMFLELAKTVLPAKEVTARWEGLLTEETDIIAHQPTGPRIHSGLTSDREVPSGKA
jgi:tRNA 2-(methylsulfanyl)-N6-isopentenyladenosine37 hydroxylase